MHKILGNISMFSKCLSLCANKLVIFNTYVVCGHVKGTFI